LFLFLSLLLCLLVLARRALTLGVPHLLLALNHEPLIADELANRLFRMTLRLFLESGHDNLRRNVIGSLYRYVTNG
jgi:hypothetical protein